MNFQQTAPSCRHIQLKSFQETLLKSDGGMDHLLTLTVNPQGGDLTNEEIQLVFSQQLVASGVSVSRVEKLRMTSLDSPQTFPNRLKISKV